ncbi:MAG: DNA-binding response regulator, partial [Actinobacteria bacterium]|nr:DNA-binding response regulator [Actinomycetota bacterium]
MKSHGWRVLVAEDDAAVRSAVVRVLELDGYRVQAVKDGRAALDALIDATPDAAVLDVMMPFVDGFTVCREIRHRGNRVPILLLTAKVEVDDRVAGLDAGADDYLVKPFAIAELSARVRALLRRNAVPESGADVTVGSISLNRDTRNVERNGRRIELTKTEFNLLELLADQAGLVVSRETIYENVWGYNFETNS